MKTSAGIFASIGCLMSCTAFAQAPTDVAFAGDLKKLSMEQLMDIRVTSVSAHREKLYEAPSAIQVITREDIHRMGATSLPEALRAATNLEVAQIDSRQWAISARGFNSSTANKLLVLIDGRTVYTPLYAGVFWDVQDLMLDDIDRIEVISGPGATIWGTNAVNGVINIITRKSGETQGLLAAADAGSELKDGARLRWGGAVGNNFHYRVYGKYFDRDATVLPDGQDAGNDWHMGQGGFRTDWDASARDRVTVQGDSYAGRIAQLDASNIAVDGGNLLGRWSHQFSQRSDFNLQLYFDRTHRDIPDQFAEGLNTYSIDLIQHFRWSERQALTWGANYHHSDDSVGNSAALAFLPADASLNWYSLFLQDQIELIANRLQLTIGSKFEQDPYSGFEYEPSGRLAWLFAQGQTLWSAISRAARSPSRIDRDFFVPGSAPYLLQGGPGFDSEKLTAYEVGYRGQLLPKLAVTLSTYYNNYDDIRSLEEVTPPAPFPVVIANGQQGDGYGAELSADYFVAERWSLRLGYDEEHLNIDPKPGSTDTSHGSAEASDPHQQVFLRSQWDLPAGFDVSGRLRYVGRLAAQQVPDYTELDVRTGWRPQQLAGLELSLVGQNLLHDHHPEFGAADQRTEIERGVYGEVLWHF